MYVVASKILYSFRNHCPKMSILYYCVVYTTVEISNSGQFSESSSGNKKLFYERFVIKITGKLASIFVDVRFHARHTIFCLFVRECLRMKEKEMQMNDWGVSRKSTLLSEINANSLIRVFINSAISLEFIIVNWKNLKYFSYCKSKFWPQITVKLKLKWIAVSL